MAKALKETVFPNCPIRNVLSRICDKWSLIVIYEMKEHREVPMRFTELRKVIPDISQKMLTSTLRTLEADGLVSRKVYPVVPPRVEYSLTDRTLTLIPIVENLLEWAIAEMPAIMRDREKQAG